MISFEENLYYNPENLGYEIVEVVGLDDEPWQFDILVVWRDPNNELVWAHDSGCSCPAPFEYHHPSDLYTFEYKEVEKFLRERWNYNRKQMHFEDALTRLRKL